jgi:hypothetical protein
MNDSYIEKTLTETFLTLNEFSAVPFIKKDASGKLTNVCLPNVEFKPPANSQYFILSFLSNEPEPAGLGTEAFNTWTGIFQIDVMIPLNVGQAEQTEKMKHLYRLYARGKSFGDVTVLKCYRAFQGVEGTSFRTTIRVEWRASLPKD